MSFQTYQWSGGTAFLLTSHQISFVALSAILLVDSWSVCVCEEVHTITCPNTQSKSSAPSFPRKNMRISSLQLKEEDDATQESLKQTVRKRRARKD